MTENPHDASELDQKVETMTEIPAEILEIIFHNLSNAQLLQIQLVCRHWLDIVRSSRKLMNRLMVKFPREIIIDEDYVPEFLNPKATSVSFRSAKIFSIPAWWKVFGERLVQLEMIDTEIKCSTFMHMLEFTPKLKNLEFAICKNLLYIAETKRKERMRFQKGATNPIFINALTNLETLHLNCDYQDFNFTGCKSSSLKQLYLSCCMPPKNSLPELLNGCPNLSNITLDNFILRNWSDVYNAFGNLKNLKILHITFLSLFFDNNGIPTAPSKDLKQLEQLDCRMSKPMMAALFGKCPQLKSARLSGTDVDDEVVLQLCRHAKKMMFLSIAHANLVTDAVAYHIAAHGTDLRELSIINCAGITNEVKEKFAPLDKMKVTIKMWKDNGSDTTGE